MQFDLNNYNKIKKLKNILSFIIIFYVNAKKSDRQSTKIQNMTSDFVDVFCCIINLTTWL